MQTVRTLGKLASILYQALVLLQYAACSV